MKLTEIKEFIEEVTGLRLCDECHGIIQEGFTNEEGEICVCENCFAPYMNRTYGQNKWRNSDKTNDAFFYEYLEDNSWEDSSLFWTNWELNTTKVQIPELEKYLDK